MPISVTYGNASNSSPYRRRYTRGGSRDNSVALSLGVFEAKQRRQEHVQDRIARQQETVWTEGYRAHAQQLRDEAQFGREQEMEETRSRRDVEQDELNWWQEQEKGLAGQVDALYGENQGEFSETGRKRYSKLQEILEKLDDDEENGKTLTPRERHEARAGVYRDFISRFNRARDVIPQDQRPGHERVTPDFRVEQRQPDGTYKDVGPASRMRLSPEQRKAQDEALFGKDSLGRPGQYRTDTHGTYFEPFEQKEASAEPSPVGKMTERLKLA
jgi:hypothetical protein